MSRFCDTMLKELLETQAAKRDSLCELSAQRPDPVMVARRYRNEYVALICALFAYGRASSIVKFLERLDFTLLDASLPVASDTMHSYYYRFQKPQDAAVLFETLRRLKQENISLYELFFEGYMKENSVIDGVNVLIATLYKYSDFQSRGFNFLIGKQTQKSKGSGTLKRWMLFIRWMVRKDSIDMGLWGKVRKSDLIIPLDTHTFHVSRKLGLLKRKSYDLHAAIELTQQLKSFDPDDPLKYDFALYRIGQERMDIDALYSKK